MKLRHEIRYDATPDQVYAMLGDPEFRRRSIDAQGASARSVDVDERAAGMVVRIDMDQPTEGVPGFAKKFAGESTHVKHAEEWDSPTTARLTIDTPGKPTTIKGTLKLTTVGAVTVETFDGEVKVKVPLIGGKLETLMGQLFCEGMDTEQGVGAAWLEEQK